MCVWESNATPVSTCDFLHIRETKETIIAVEVRKQLVDLRVELNILCSSPEYV
jgi:hypothetical protein